MLARRWVSLAIGAGTVAAAASVAAFVLAREPAPPPLPDRVQLTLTGNASSPSISPDGTRLALAEKQCDPMGSCTYQLVIQDVEGTGRLVLTRDIGYIYKTQWTRDGRFVVFAGSYPPLRHGSFAVSTLGGETRFLGCCSFDVVAGDTSFLVAGQLPGLNPSWVRRITIHDGQTVDSIPVGEAKANYAVIALPIPNRLIVARGKAPEAIPELRLTDFNGRVIDSLTPPFASLGRDYLVRWGNRLVVASQREPGGTDFDIVTMRVTASRIERTADTVLSGLELGNGIFDLSPNAQRLIYYGGPVETSLSTIDVDPAKLATTPALFSTTVLRGRISPAGDRILLARAARRGGAHASQFSLMPRVGGAESQIPGAVENLVDFQWSPDGGKILLLHGIGENRTRLIERDTAGGGTREIRRFEQSRAITFHPLPDGTVGVLNPDRRSISIIRRPGRSDVTLHFPDWLGVAGSMSHSANARSLIVEGISRASDSVVVATVDIETGHFTRVASFAGSDPQQVAGVQDGSITSVFREPEGAWAVYKIPPGRPPTKLGTLPHTRAEFSVSSDGKHVAMFGYRDRTDVYMIRNFGALTRR